MESIKQDSAIVDGVENCETTVAGVPFNHVIGNFVTFVFVHQRIIFVLEHSKNEGYQNIRRIQPNDDHAEGTSIFEPISMLNELNYHSTGYLYQISNDRTLYHYCLSGGQWSSD